MGEDGSGSPLLLLIMAVVAHLALIAIVVYYACCRNGCTCKITIQDHAESSTSPVVSLSDGDNLVERGPVSNWWQTTLLTRVRAHLTRSRNSTVDSDDAESHLPPPYGDVMTFSALVDGHDNDGADLPSYNECIEREVRWQRNPHTGTYEREKPPKYEEVVNH
ncbi:hypothetical protein DPMN_085110 [Dreissena polymorpha]|uniref:Uncharacterized protein n=1 Tax=Dreissena polymorpha TaxID=45954 RepID=A0A9D3YEF4_DREPO|nr:hypothetical protein DPMN_085110 [Dreissena polymorpha]